MMISSGTRKTKRHAHEDQPGEPRLGLDQLVERVELAVAADADVDALALLLDDDRRLVGRRWRRAAGRGAGGGAADSRSIFVSTPAGTGGDGDGLAGVVGDRRLRLRRLGGGGRAVRQDRGGEADEEGAAENQPAGEGRRRRPRRGRVDADTWTPGKGWSRSLDAASSRSGFTGDARAWSRIAVRRRRMARARRIELACYYRQNGYWRRKSPRRRDLAQFHRSFAPSAARLTARRAPHAIDRTDRLQNFALRCRLAPRRAVAFPSAVARLSFAAVAVLAALLAVRRADHRAAARAADDAVTLNFVNADIDAVVKAIAEITGKSFIVDPKVKGTVNIVSARPVARALVYPTLLSALRMQGFTAVESDDVVRIVPEADAKLQGGAVHRGPTVGAGSGDRIVTQVVQLRYESAASLVNVLRPLIAPNNTIAALPGSQRADHHRLRRQPAPARPHHRHARPAARRRAGAGAGAPRVGARPGADAQPAAGRSGRGRRAGRRRRTRSSGSPSSPTRARTPSSFASDNPGRVARVRQLIEQLDTPGRAGGNMFIVYLKNADATRVAQTLRALMTGADTTTNAGGTFAARAGSVGRAAAAASAWPVRVRRRRRRSPTSGSAGGRRRLLRRRRDDPGRHREQRADHHGAGARLQQPAHGDRQARRPSRAGVRRGADRRGRRRQGGRVRHPVAGAVGHDVDADARHRRHQLRQPRRRQPTSSTARSTSARWGRGSTSASSAAR